MLFSPGDTDPVYFRECRDFRKGAAQKCRLPPVMWTAMPTHKLDHILLRDQEARFVYESAPDVSMREIHASLNRQVFQGSLRDGRHMETYTLTVRFDVGKAMRERGVWCVANLCIDRRRATWWGRFTKATCELDADFDAYSV